MAYDFNEIIDRRGTNCGKWEFEMIQNPHAGVDTLPFWVADMDFPCPEGVIEALHKRVDNRIFGYSGQYTGEFYRSVCGWFWHRFHWYVNAKDIFYSNGIVAALGFLVKILTHEDDQVLVQPPVYRPFYKKILVNHRKAVDNRLIENDGYYEIDFDDFEEKVKDPKTTLFILCSPHNPVGRVWTKEELKRMAGLCHENGVRIVADEIHHDIINPSCTHYPLETLVPYMKDEIITCTAVSKTFNMAGLQFSNIIIHDPYIQEKWKQVVQDNIGILYPNALSITAVQAAYATGEEWLGQVTEYIWENLKQTRKYLEEHLPLAKMQVPEGTYFAWVNVKPYLQGEAGIDIESFLVKKVDVLIEGGSVFGPGGETFIRINTACPRKLLMEGLRRICNALRRFYPGMLAADVPFHTAWQENLSLREYVKKPTYLVFLRYYGCTMCQLDLRHLNENYDRIKENGAELAVVLQSSRETIREEIAEETYPFDIICDETKELYETYGILPAVSMEKMANRDVLKKIGEAKQRGLVHGKYEGNELQLPAVFLIGSDGRIKNCYYGSHPADLPKVEAMLAWLD